MLWSPRYLSCISALWALPSSSQPTAGTGFLSRDVAAYETIARRACTPAVPDVSESVIIADVCNQTLANNFDLCSTQMTVSMQKSATNTCGQYLGLFTNCLMANKNDSTACTDPLLGYQDCKLYTMQAYAYCGCYYTLPKSIADCANQQLQTQPRDTAMVPKAEKPSIAITTSFKSLAKAVTTDQEPTPFILADSGEPTSASGRSPPTSSDPPIPSAPSDNFDTTWSPNAAPRTDSEPATVVLTYTSTFTLAAYYTLTATIISTATSTIYTCADNGGERIPASPTAPTAPTATAPASDIFAPYSAIVPAAQSTGTETTTPDATTAEGSGSRKPSTSTSTFLVTYPFPSSPAAPAPNNTGIVPSSAAMTPVRNGSAVCAAGCRRGRRSKIF